HRILWLDWRVLAGLPVKDDMTNWMGFCSGHLVPALPPGVYVIVTIALEEPAPKLDSVQKLLETIANEPDHRRDELRFTVLLPIPDPFVILDPEHPEPSRRAVYEAQRRPPTLGNHEEAARFYKPDAPLVTAVNAALVLGVPLLLTGEAGTGKTQVAYWLQHHL